MIFNLDNRKFSEVNNEPNKLAVSASDGDFSWIELFSLVELQLKKLEHFRKGTPVIVYGHKEINFVSMVVACLILELPYIPVDSSVPKNRLKVLKKILNSNITYICSEDVLKHDKEFGDTLYWNPTDPICYIMFTSGSTGEPKGVKISKSSILNFLKWSQISFSFSSDDVFLNQASFGFDLSVIELYSFLSLGASIVLNEREICEKHDSFIHRIKKYKCNTWISTPSFLSRTLLSKAFSKKELPFLTKFLFCGETLNHNLVGKHIARFPKNQIFNLYGPTEATVAVSKVEITKEIIEQFPNSLPVGDGENASFISIEQPDSNNIGEIKITGKSVGLGFLNSIPPLLSNSEEKELFTGDIGYEKDGFLFFKNRIDFQIKLHGHRINLMEVNNEVEKHPAVNCAYTLPLKRNGLVVKVVSFINIDCGKNLIKLKGEINLFLESNLPSYMVPGDLYLSESKFPLNNNHKIDELKMLEMYKING